MQLTVRLETRLLASRSKSKRRSRSWEPWVRRLQTCAANWVSRWLPFRNTMPRLKKPQLLHWKHSKHSAWARLNGTKAPSTLRFPSTSTRSNWTPISPWPTHAWGRCITTPAREPWRAKAQNRLLNVENVPAKWRSFIFRPTITRTLLGNGTRRFSLVQPRSSFVVRVLIPWRSTRSVLESRFPVRSTAGLLFPALTTTARLCPLIPRGEDCSRASRLRLTRRRATRNIPANDSLPTRGNDFPLSHTPQDRWWWDGNRVR